MEWKNQDVDPGPSGSRNHGDLRREFRSSQTTRMLWFLKGHMGKSPCFCGANRDRSENHGKRMRAQDEVKGQEGPLLLALMFLKKIGRPH